MMVDSQNPNAFGEKDLQLFTNIANQAALNIANAALAQRIEREALARARFQRLLSPSIAELVVSGKVEVKQGGEPRTTTMLFSDIRGFTSRSETVPAEQIVTMLNDYFERMVEIVFRHEGTLDKFVGDEIMALFGAPVSHPDDAVRAVRVALAMLDDLRAFNTEREAQGHPPFEIGIGINTGEVVAGYIGSSKAMQYTVIGAPVNLAARLCSAAKGMQILLSETTLSLVRDHFEVRELSPSSPRASPSPCGCLKCSAPERGHKGRAWRRWISSAPCATSIDASPPCAPWPLRAPATTLASRRRSSDSKPARSSSSATSSTSSAPGTRCSSRVTPSGPTPSTM